MALAASEAQVASRSSMGALAQLPDEILDEILERIRDARALGMCAQTCAAMRVLCYEEPLWKSIALDAYKGPQGPSREIAAAEESGEDDINNSNTAASFRYVHSWRCTGLMLVLGIEEAQALKFIGDRAKLRRVDSPFLYARWYRGNVSLEGFAGETSSVPRIRNVTYDYFQTNFLSCNSPAMICDLQGNWAATRLWQDRNSFAERCGEADFFCNTVNSAGTKIRMKIGDFLQYMDQQRDESPLYIFDSTFGENVPLLLEDYDVPDIFPDDFFSVLGSDRPYYRWLTIGPSRSGASWHVDPYLTSAWNSLIVGEKRWALYPPGRIPPGLKVEVDDDGEPEVLTEITSLQWYLEVYPHLQEEDKPMEITQLPGETIFVPSGWWHCVLNLRQSVAVTQNFVDRFNFRTVAGEFIPGSESTPASVEASSDRGWGKAHQVQRDDASRDYRRLRRLRHWLRLLLEESPRLVNLIIEIGDQAFQLKELISSLETICTRHQLEMPRNEGLFPLKGGSEPVFDIGDKVVKLISIKRTGRQEADILNQIQSLPESHRLLKHSTPIVEHFSEDYCVLSKCKGQSLRELRQAHGATAHLNQAFSKLGRVIAQLHTMKYAQRASASNGQGAGPESCEAFSARLHQGRQAMASDMARRRLLHRDLWDSLDEYLLSGDKLFLRRCTCDLELQQRCILSCCSEVIAHGDLTEDNILFDTQFSQVHLIDFGDSTCGDPLYDLIGIYLSSCRGDVGYMNVFLGSYCDELKVLQPCSAVQNGDQGLRPTLVRDIYGLSLSDIKHLALYYVLVHEENALEAAVMCIPSAPACSSFQELEEALFGKLNI